MTLLSRGITSSQGPSSLDNVITKLQKDQQTVENQISTFNNNLYGVKSSMNYVGEKGKSVLQTYNSQIESLMEQYAADPSQEIKTQISELVVQAKDFANKATAERQVGVEQLNDIVANPQNYDISVEEARRIFAERYDTPLETTFDPQTKEILIRGQEGPIRLGAYGQYNGEDPFFVPKKSDMEVIKPSGEWASQNKDLFDLKSSTLQSDVQSSFVKSARYDDKLASTAVYNYLLDVEKMNLSSMSETGVSKAVQDVMNDPERLNAALEHQGNIEAQKLGGYVTSVNDKAMNEEWDKVFTGGVNDLDEEPSYEAYSIDNGMTGTASKGVAPNAGVFDTYDLKTPVDGSLVTSLGEDARITSFNVDEIGRFHVIEEVIEVDGDGNEIIVEKEKVYEAGSDVYRSLKNIIPAQVRAKMQGNSQRRAGEYKSQMSNQRFQQAQQRTQERQRREQEEQTALTKEAEEKAESTRAESDARTEEQKAADVSKVVSDVGLNSPASDRQTQGVFDATTYGGQPTIRKISEILVEKGFTPEQISQTLKSDTYGRMLEDKGLSPESSSLRRAASGIADSVFGWAGYKSGMQENIEKMAGVAEEAMMRDSMRANITQGAREGARDSEKPSEDIQLMIPKDRKAKAQNYEVIRNVAREEGLPFPEAVAAQFAMESAYGEKLPAKNNFFGIKYTPRMQRIYEEKGINTSQGSEVTTSEFYDGQTESRIQDTFFNFETPRDAIKAYKIFIEENPRYKSALESDSTETYLRRLKSAGYATDPDYDKKLIQVVNDNERIVQDFDNGQGKETAR